MCLGKHFQPSGVFFASDGKVEPLFSDSIISACWILGAGRDRFRPFRALSRGGLFLMIGALSDSLRRIFTEFLARL